MPTPREIAVAKRTASRVQLVRALPELRAKELQLSDAAEREGIIYRIADYGGWRDAAMTARILAFRDADYKAAVRVNPNVAAIPITRWRPIAPFGLSRHDWGAAFDAEPLVWPLGLTRGRAMQRLAELAPTVGLVNGASFHDLPHMELPGALAYWKARYLAFTASTATKVGVGAVFVAALALVAIRATRGAA